MNQKIENFAQFMAEARRIEREQRCEYIREAAANGNGAKLLSAINEVLDAHERQIGRERDEADRRAGEAERNAADLFNSHAKRQQWLAAAKRDAGYPDNISFDVVWADALRALKRSKT